jgi:AcrR family transcriptional regulator
MVAMAELMAEHGYRNVSIGQVATRSGVSRSAFYECFTDKEDCAFAAYDRFIEVLLGAIADRMRPADDWNGFIVGLLDGYLATLKQDLVVARAFQVEMDAVGAEARRRRRAALMRFAEFIRGQHERLRTSDTTLSPVSAQAYLGAVYAIRKVASDALDEQAEPDLLAIVPQLADWVGESFRATSDESLRQQMPATRPRAVRSQ